MRNPRPVTLAAAAAALMLASSPARVHPHVFADARLEVMVGPDGTVKSLRHLWRFDDLFSSTVLMEFDKNSDLELDDSELEEVANTVHASLAEYNYFQLVTAGDKEIAMQPPTHLVATFEDQQLMILFESMPKEPLKLAGKLSFAVYDPTFYTAIDFTDDQNLAVTPMPDNCKRAVVRPDPDQIIASNSSTLTEAFFNDPAGTDLTKIFATRLELECHAEG